MTGSTPSRGPGSEMEVHVHPFAARGFAAMDPVLDLLVPLGPARQLQPVADVEHPLVARRTWGGGVDELPTVVAHQPRLDTSWSPGEARGDLGQGSASGWVSAGLAGR